jgi:hypothetical protein
MALSWNMHKHGTAGDCLTRLQYLKQIDSQLIAYPANCKGPTVQQALQRI